MYYKSYIRFTVIILFIVFANILTLGQSLSIFNVKIPKGEGTDTVVNRNKNFLLGWCNME